MDVNKNLIMKGNQKKLDALYESSEFQPSKSKANYITNKAFSSNLNSWSLATLIAISSFNRFSNAGENFSTKAISKNSIFTELRLTNDKNHRNKNRLNDAFNSLIAKEVISVEYITENKNDFDRLMVITQLFDDTSTFTAIDYYNYDLILLAVANDAERINLLAAYASVSNRIYHYDARDAASKINEAKKSVCYETLEEVGKKYGVSRTTASRHVKALVDINILALIEIQLSKSKNCEITYYLSRFKEVHAMKQFIMFQIDLGEIKRVNVSEEIMNRIRDVKASYLITKQSETVDSSVQFTEIDKYSTSVVESVRASNRQATATDYFMSWFGLKRMTNTANKRIADYVSAYGEEVTLSTFNQLDKRIRALLKSKLADKSTSNQLNYIARVIDDHIVKVAEQSDRSKRVEKALEQVNVDLSKSESVYISRYKPKTNLQSAFTSLNEELNDTEDDEINFEDIFI